MASKVILANKKREEKQLFLQRLEARLDKQRGRKMRQCGIMLDEEERYDRTIPTRDQSSLLGIQRRKFLLFIRILMHTLEEKPALYREAKAIIAACNQRRKLGDPCFENTQDVLEVLLHDLVGDERWEKTEKYTRLYLYLCKSSQVVPSKFFEHPVRRLCHIE